MIRSYEKDLSWKAGALSVGVHAALLIALLISFNWKAAHTVSISEVELWDSLPNSAVSKPLPPPEPAPVPIVKEQPKPAPKPVVEDKPKEDVKVDIALEKKLKELEQKKIDDQLKKDKALEQKKQLVALKEEARKDEMRDSDKLSKEKSARDALKKLQQDSLSEDKAEGDQKNLAAKVAANTGAIGEFTNKIKAKIRGNVNKTLCGDGNPELKFEIGLLPTGELTGNPKLVKSSGNTACDDAVERAIRASEPLPVPTEASLFSQFRNLKLTFRPND